MNDNDSVEGNVAKRMLFKRPALSIMWGSLHETTNGITGLAVSSKCPCNRADISCSAQPCKAINERILRLFAAAVEATYLGNLVPFSLLCCQNACLTVNQCS